LWNTTSYYISSAHLTQITQCTLQQFLISGGTEQSDKSDSPNKKLSVPFLDAMHCQISRSKEIVEKNNVFNTQNVSFPKYNGRVSG